MCSLPALRTIYGLSDKDQFANAAPLQEPDAAAAIVRANVPIVKPEQAPPTTSTTAAAPRPHNPQRSWSTDLGGPPKFDKLGRRILSSNTASGVNSGTGTPRRGDSDVRPLLCPQFYKADMLTENSLMMTWSALLRSWPSTISAPSSSSRTTAA